MGAPAPRPRGPLTPAGPGDPAGTVMRPGAPLSPGLIPTGSRIRQEPYEGPAPRSRRALTPPGRAARRELFHEARRPALAGPRKQDARAEDEGDNLGPGFLHDFFAGPGRRFSPAPAARPVCAAC